MSAASYVLCVTRRGALIIHAYEFQLTETLCITDAARKFKNIPEHLAATAIAILFTLSHFFVKSSFESVPATTLRKSRRETIPNFVYLKINNL